jgi:hypothetical protein
MIPACLPPLEPTRPKAPPPIACDTHVHVLDPVTQQRMLVSDPAKLHGFSN